MSKPMTQVKFTIDKDIVAAFKARCAAEDVSMASVISKWMKGGRSEKSVKIDADTRPKRRKMVLGMIDLLEELLQKEEAYRDAIPENFQSRYEAADQTCEQLSQAITCLGDAY
jgi:hypothetical protein